MSAGFAMEAAAKSSRLFLPVPAPAFTASPAARNPYDEGLLVQAEGAGARPDGASEDGTGGGGGSGGGYTCTKGAGGAGGGGGGYGRVRINQGQKGGELSPPRRVFDVRAA